MKLFVQGFNLATKRSRISYGPSFSAAESGIQFRPFPSLEGSLPGPAKLELFGVKLPRNALVPDLPDRPESASGQFEIVVFPGWSATRTRASCGQRLVRVARNSDREYLRVGDFTSKWILASFREPRFSGGIPVRTLSSLSPGTSGR